MRASLTLVPALGLFSFYGFVLRNFYMIVFVLSYFVLFLLLSLISLFYFFTERQKEWTKKEGK